MLEASAGLDFLERCGMCSSRVALIPSTIETVKRNLSRRSVASFRPERRHAAGPLNPEP